ncbi:LysR family transcriptional regulator [Kitasatospora sp. NPDC088134]|uniref:LysR family transcriptional regulator n=1 Tax=Kitasatospora sp. NPDC088134 TaxID=3364071 RepID=UPI0038055D6D
MTGTLDIGVLRSLAAIGDHGGFHRAAAALGISQSAVSQHVRRLERTLGRPLVERSGRGIRFTPAGELALTEARRVLAVHDEALVRLGVTEPAATGYLIGSTEHVAERVLPAITRTASTQLPGRTVRFRLDRGGRLHQALDEGALDAAVFIGDNGGRPGELAGGVPLSWFAAPEWDHPAPGTPVPLVAIDGPCVLRDRALSALRTGGRTVTVIAEAAQLVGVISAVRSGLGVALLADHGPPPPGLVRLRGLPAVPPEPLYLRYRAGAPRQLAGVLRTALDTLSGSGLVGSGS